MNSEESRAATEISLNIYSGQSNGLYCTDWRPSVMFKIGAYGVWLRSRLERRVYLFLCIIKVH